jgi:hypothetical protein
MDTSPFLIIVAFLILLYIAMITSSFKMSQKSIKERRYKPTQEELEFWEYLGYKVSDP